MPMSIVSKVLLRTYNKSDNSFSHILSKDQAQLGPFLPAKKEGIITIHLAANPDGEPTVSRQSRLRSSFRQYEICTICVLHILYYIFIYNIHFKHTIRGNTERPSVTFRMAARWSRD